MTDTTDFAAVFNRLVQTGDSEETVTSGGVAVRMVRIPRGGEGRWDRHAHTPETAIVWSGDFQVEFRDHTVSLQTGQCCVIPAETDHRGTSRSGAEVVLFTQAA